MHERVLASAGRARLRSLGRRFAALALAIGIGVPVCARTGSGAGPGAAPSARPAATLPAPAYEQTPASSDGTGKRFMGREIAQVMGWAGAAWLERAEREREERTDLLLGALSLRPGMQVADVGAGTGFVARRIARRVGRTGRVWAVDVQPEMVAASDELARRDGLPQVRGVLGSETEMPLPPSSVDLALLVDVYHELAYPVEVIRSVVRTLKPGGRLALVEYRADDPAVAIKPLHTMSETQVRREMAVHPLAWERTVRLPLQNVVIFRRTR
ncbi:class I SAM-dependent methyltransferase [Piscinibacter koreensis]|uniref:Methyltransferase domain-containing protein n=1 Tax=Piscinibacter koreensis TaxID=2742824 RepID=A0A7Y6NRS7_9BURK|nr:methyltransferase domain-containing protein [Schlegelella koreensis]NUZ08172.1 methyltransferase domain-containing protein [Schlegelella koreensis]